MYHYIEDKTFLKNLRSTCSNIVNQLVQAINRDGKIEVKAHLVGSGARNMETQNANEPVDLDYNLWICSCDDYKKCREIKEYIRKIYQLSALSPGQRLSAGGSRPNDHLGGSPFPFPQSGASLQHQKAAGHASYHRPRR